MSVCGLVPPKLILHLLICASTVQHYCCTVWRAQLSVSLERQPRPSEHHHQQQQQQHHHKCRQLSSVSDGLCAAAAAAAKFKRLMSISDAESLNFTGASHC